MLLAGPSLNLDVKYEVVQIERIRENTDGVV